MTMDRHALRPRDDESNPSLRVPCFGRPKLQTDLEPPAVIASEARRSIAPGKMLGKTPDLILLRLAETPGASIPELAQHLDKSDSAIERAIRKLRAEGKLRRIGPAKGGYWEVIE